MSASRGETLMRFFAARMVEVYFRYQVRLGGGDWDNLEMVLREAYDAVVPPRPTSSRPRRQKSPSSARTLALLKVPCTRCGSTDRVVLDHITPVVQGGRYVEGNVQPLCTSCNNSKGAR